MEGSRLRSPDCSANHPATSPPCRPTAPASRLSSLLRCPARTRPNMNIPGNSPKGIAHPWSKRVCNTLNTTAWAAAAGIPLSRNCNSPQSHPRNTSSSAKPTPIKATALTAWPRVSPSPTRACPSTRSTRLKPSSTRAASRRPWTRARMDFLKGALSPRQRQGRAIPQTRRRRRGRQTRNNTKAPRLTSSFTTSGSIPSHSRGRVSNQVRANSKGTNSRVPSQRGPCFSSRLTFPVQSYW